MSVLDATLTSKGQITIPVEIRRLWNLKTGDEIEFFQDHRGEFCIRPCNAGSIDFLSVVQPKKKLPEFETDDDAIADAIISRNIPANKKQAA
jgi:antitoxin PrlF